METKEQPTKKPFVIPTSWLIIFSNISGVSILYLMLGFSKWVPILMLTLVPQMVLLILISGAWTVVVYTKREIENITNRQKSYTDW